MKKPSDTEETPISIAVLDDCDEILCAVAQCLRAVSQDVRPFSSPAKFLAEMERRACDILITDVRMPEMDGLTVLAKVKDQHPSVDVIVMTAHADKQIAVEALKLGAFDLLEKPVNRDELVLSVQKTLQYRKALQERDRLAGHVSLLSQREAERWGIQAFVGQSPAMRVTIQNIRLLQKAAGTSVLVTGESGTGKELVARAIHFGGTRALNPFIPVNCAALPTELAESALFGHVRGAFTGAATDKVGAFAAADGGTIFLDEIGDMSLPVQAKLLRVLDDRLVIPVGAVKGRKVDVRVISATNADLSARVASQEFRSDLYFRMAGFTVTLPPLRERPEDVPLLAAHFVRLFCSEMGLPTASIAAESIHLLCRHPFPGNVREMKNMMERALIESAASEIKPEHLHFARLSDAKEAPVSPGQQEAPGQGGDLALNLAQVEQGTIARAMAIAEGNVSAAARLLGIGRGKLYRRFDAGARLSGARK